jgi:probable HAF family extracellular repeat protein
MATKAVNRRLKMKLQNNCKFRIFANVIAVTLLVGMAMPVVTFAQEQKEEKNEKIEHHHYKLVDIGTFGGPNSSLSGPSFQILNNRGAFAAIVDTATPNPNASCNIPFSPPDCFVEHAAVWHNGTLTDLGVLPGGANSQTIWISGNGLIAGLSENGLIDPLTGQPEVVAALWTKDGKIIDLGTVPGGTESVALSVNSHGQVVGFSSNDIPDAFSFFGFSTQTRAFLWQNGVMKDLGTLGGPDAVALFVNDRGQVAGFSYTDSTVNPSTGKPTTHPFLWENGKMTDLGTLGGTFAGPEFSGFSFGQLNNRGEVVGASFLAGDVTEHPFLWTKSEGMKDLGTLGGTFGFATWINDIGEVVGIANTLNDQGLHAFFWRDGVMTDIGTIGSDPASQANSINSRGQVVGATFDNATTVDIHGFLWEDGGPIVDLNTLVPPGSGATITSAVDINDRGEIAANGFLANGDARAFLLIPCDENHAGVEDCNFDTVDAETEAPVRSAQITTALAAASATKLSPAERMARFRSLMAGRNRRFGAAPPK